MFFSPTDAWHSDPLEEISLISTPRWYIEIKRRAAEKVLLPVLRMRPLPRLSPFVNRYSGDSLDFEPA